MNHISFLIPVFNLKIEELSTCVASIASQTVSRDNYEIIIIDDGSNNGIESICDELGQKYDAIVIHQANLGLAAARNAGIKAAHGEWIVHVDGDDWVRDDLAKSLLCSVNNNDVDIVVWGYIIANGFNRQELLLRNKAAFDNDYRYIKDNVLCSILDFDTSFSALAINTSWGKAYRREFIEKEKLFYDLSLRRAQDAVYNLNAFFCAKRVHYIDKALNYYRNDNTSLSRSFNPKTYDYLLLTSLAVQDFVSRKDLSQRVRDAADVFVKRCFRMINMQYYQHKDNPQSFLTRRKLFLDGIDTEPFRSAFSSKKHKEGFYYKITDILFRKKMFGSIWLFNYLFNFVVLVKNKLRVFHHYY